MQGDTVNCPQICLQIVPKRKFIQTRHKNKSRKSLRDLGSDGAHNRDRTGDLRLTKATLCLLSYVGIWLRGPDLNRQPSGYEPDELPLLHPAPWWRGQDSNLRRLRQQIYSLPPLTTREPLHKSYISGADEGTRTPRPADYKSAALPVELRRLFLFPQSII
ncbi:MAG: hypothetical protein XD63_0968 [Thermoanaerobacterales bacterium 50_218]|nr:MAG: hypothetical protein XD63_0968 [Thermoanaerobacterales bacterium 50_218]